MGIETFSPFAKQKQKKSSLFKHIMPVQPGHLSPRNGHLSHTPPHSTHLPSSTATARATVLAHIPSSPTELLDHPAKTLISVLSFA